MLKRGWFLKAAGIVYPTSVRIQTPRQTLEAVRAAILQQTPGGYFRFGDGEVNILYGLGSIDQGQSSSMPAEMKRAFALSGPGIIKSLMIHSDRFGKSEGMRKGIHWTADAWATRLLDRCFEYFIGEKIYSHAALAYAAVYDQAYALEFLNFLKSFQPIFIGNREAPPRLIEQLWGKTDFIPASPKNAYAEIDRLEAQAVKAIFRRGRSFDVVVVALGPTSNILQERLISRHHLPVFTFDFGSLLSVFMGDFNRAWMTEEGLEKKDWEKFLSQI